MQVEVTFKGTANEITAIMARLSGNERIELATASPATNLPSGDGDSDTGKPRRHRRTKAEMEAARQAETQGSAGKATGDELETGGEETDDSGSDLDDLGGEEGTEEGTTEDGEVDSDFSDLDDTPPAPAPAPKKTAAPPVKLVSSKPTADKSKAAAPATKPAQAAKPVAGSAIGIDSHILPAMRAYATRKGGGTVGREAAAAVLAKFGVKTVRALSADKLPEVYKLLQK